jgi:hypothetical protein
MRTGGAGGWQRRSGAQADWEAAAIELLAGLWRLRLELALVGAAVAGQRLSPVRWASRSPWSRSSRSPALC